MEAIAKSEGIKGVINFFTDIGLSIVPLLAAIAFLIFVWGVAKFIRSAGSEKDLKESKNMLIWGVIGLFILVTIWGIIAFLRGDILGGGQPFVPQIPQTIKGGNTI